jgi:hypothetical protein
MKSNVLFVFLKRQVLYTKEAKSSTEREITAYQINTFENTLSSNSSYYFYVYMEQVSLIFFSKK